jgi:hypothetical protein
MSLLGLGEEPTGKELKFEPPARQSDTAESIRRMFRLPLDSADRKNWVDAVVTSAHDRVGALVLEQYRDPFKRLVRLGEVGRDELEEYTQDFWIQIIDELSTSNEPGSTLEEWLLDPLAFDKLLIIRAKCRAIDRIRVILREEEEKEKAVELHQQFVAASAAFVYVMESPTPPRYPALSPSDLTVFFCARLCKTYTPTDLVTTECACCFLKLVESASKQSIWFPDTVAPGERVESALVNPSPYRKAWSAVTLCCCLEQSDAASPTGELQERRRRIVNQWIERVERRVLLHQKPGDAAGKVLAKLPQLFNERYAYFCDRVLHESHAIPLAVLAWAHVRLMACHTFADVGALTVAQAIDELRDGLRKRTLNLPPALDSWLHKAGTRTISEEAALLGLDLSKAIADVERRAARWRTRPAQPTGN